MAFLAAVWLKHNPAEQVSQHEKQPEECKKKKTPLADYLATMKLKAEEEDEDEDDDDDDDDDDDIEMGDDSD